MTPNSSTDSATRDGLEVVATAAKVLVRQLNQAAWNSGNADAEDSWKRQERTAAAQDKLLNETLAAVDTLLAASRAEVERLRAALQSIADLDPETDSDEGYNEWGEAVCFGLAKDRANAALSTKKD